MNSSRRTMTARTVLQHASLVAVRGGGLTGLSYALLLLAGVEWSVAGILLAQPHGIESRVPNTEIRITTPPGGAENSVPVQLSDMPALLQVGAGQGHTVAGVVPYEPSAKLYSDGALKERYVVLPDYAFVAPDLPEIAFSSAGAWGFPENTVLVKNFVLPIDARDPAGSLKRLETRLLVKFADGWQGFSYEWNDEETDATLLTENKDREFMTTNAEGQAAPLTWTYPVMQCFECHSDPARPALGLNTAQLNFEYLYPQSQVVDNQVRTLAHLGLFDTPLPAAPEELPSIPDAFDTTASVEDRARAYLSVNCGVCHRPGGRFPLINLTFEATLAETNVINKAALRLPPGMPPGSVLVAPGRPEDSVLLRRMSVPGSDAFRMPPLGRQFVDNAAVELVSEWIAGIEEHSFQRGNCDGVGPLDLTDAVYTLNFLFLGGAEPPCREACDADSNKRLDLTDGVYTLNFLFLAGPPPGSYPDCEAAPAESCAAETCTAN